MSYWLFICAYSIYSRLYSLSEDCILYLRLGGGVPFRGNREVLNMAHNAVRVVKSNAVSGMVFVARVTVRLKFRSVSQEIKAQVG